MNDSTTRAAPSTGTTRKGKAGPSRRLAMPKGGHAGGQSDWPYCIDPELRYRMISEGAYHRYLGRGCGDGYDLDDWLAAEAEVDRQLSQAGQTNASAARPSGRE